MYALLKLRLILGKMILFVNTVNRCYRYLSDFTITHCLFILYTHTHTHSVSSDATGISITHCLFILYTHSMSSDARGISITHCLYWISSYLCVWDVCVLWHDPGPSVVSAKSHSRDFVVTLQLHQGIHRHQTLSWYRNATSGSRLKVQPSAHCHTAHYGQT